MRDANLLEKRWDESYLSNSGICPIHRIIVRVFRKHINRVICSIILRAYERSQISGDQMHAVLAISDRILYPKTK